MEVTYAETRLWAVWLQTFTPSDLARSMGVPVESIEGFIFGLQFNGTIMDTGDSINGTGPSEQIYTFVPLPLGPTHHFTREPEWRSPGCYSLAPRRGLAVRIRSDRDTRRLMGQGSGGARHRLIQAERRYKAQMEAVEKRKEAQKAKAARGERTTKTSSKRKAAAMAAARSEKRKAKHRDRMFD